jgi:hypothetical protein
MNKTAFIFLAGLLLLSGCAQTYVITTSSGEHISTKGKPHLVNGFYVYKDPFGQPGKVQAIVVREVAPTSMVTDETAGFKPVSSR